MTNDYYKTVKTYYDEDADDFDKRYWQNPVLQTIRQSFREEVKKHPFKNMLEIGYGTGLDMVHFAVTHPEVTVYGIDISGEMHRIATNRAKKKELERVVAVEGSVEDLERLFPGKRFDIIYVFFGALNTVSNLDETARVLKKILNKDGIMVLTFVNKYYILGMLIECIKLRFSNAFARLRPVWGGYSPVKYLPSRCYSPKEIINTFSGLDLQKKQGYSILHPAWYYHGLNRRLGRFRKWLWKADILLNNTFLWKFGEYTLFVFKMR
ncbi:class I SAM-dependent methyltransferase [Mariniphaga sediminis]|uniref:class I SAM-dependent methyltransferase n=1 Tax=Mariniphaga sediminis TaxID=1628158 RepID=UPI00356178CC